MKLQGYEKDAPGGGEMSRKPNPYPYRCEFCGKPLVPARNLYTGTGWAHIKGCPEPKKPKRKPAVGQFKTRLHYMSEIQERARKELGASETSVRLLYLALTDIDKNHRLDFRKLAECSEMDFRHDIIGMSDYATNDGVLHGWKPKCHKPTVGVLRRERR